MWREWSVLAEGPLRHPALLVRLHLRGPPRLPTTSCTVFPHLISDALESKSYDDATRRSRTWSVGRLRWSHARRKFFAALETSPDEAHHAIDLIRGIYEVEYTAAEKEILGTDEHRALRTTKSRELVTTLFDWATTQRDKHLPKGPLGTALKYLINQRKTLERFLDDPQIRLDNNIAEQHLRLIALGRKNFLFVGHDQAGRNLATLQTLVSTCLANNVNPHTYLTDVLLRIDSTPHTQIDTLLPWNWRGPPQID